MRIVEISDYSMVIMKDSQDPPWVSVGDIYREAVYRGYNIRVNTVMNFYSQVPIPSAGSQISSEAVYTAGRLILYFSEPINSAFHLHDSVRLSLG